MAAFFLCIFTFASPARSGLVSGPTIKIDHFPSMTKTNYTITLKGEEVASIVIKGNERSDLDCFLYDKNNDLIAKDTNRTDVCIMRIIPGVTGDFKLVIANLGETDNVATLEFN